MISTGHFKGEQAVVMENETLKVVLLPGLGGKTASIYRKDRDFELLFQNNAGVYQKPWLYAPFEQFDAAGFDDAFPSIDEEHVSLSSGPVLYPDHGEIWCANFDYCLEQDCVAMTYRSKILSYDYTKKVSLDGDSVIYRYNIVNCGEMDMPCLWTMHCLIHCEENMELLFPKGTEEMLNVKDSDYLGNIGAVHHFPKTKTALGTSYRLDRVFPPTALKAEKYYVNGKVDEGFCGAVYPSAGVRYTVTYDKDKLPYLGFWITEGGFRGDYNCAMEPSNGFYDSVKTAQRNNSLCFLKKGCAMTLEIRIRLELI